MRFVTFGIPSRRYLKFIQEGMLSTHCKYSAKFCYPKLPNRVTMQFTVSVPCSAVALTGTALWFRRFSTPEEHCGGMVVANFEY
jgi:hypothetical protein